jgi:hypothetical protein
MRGAGAEIASWSDGFRAYMHPKAIAMLFLGLSAGIPILLIFSTLSVWLREAGVERSAVTFFSWAALGYSFKFCGHRLSTCCRCLFSHLFLDAVERGCW